MLILVGVILNLICYSIEAGPTILESEWSIADLHMDLLVFVYSYSYKNVQKTFENTPKRIGKVEHCRELVEKNF